MAPSDDIFSKLFYLYPCFQLQFTLVVWEIVSLIRNYSFWQCNVLILQEKGKIKIRTQFWKKSGNKYLCHAAKKEVFWKLPEDETITGEGQEIAKFVLIIKTINANIFWILNYHSTPFPTKQINFMFYLSCEHKLWISFCILLKV